MARSIPSPVLPTSTKKVSSNRSSRPAHQFIGAWLLCLGALLPLSASAYEAYAAKDLHLRAGPARDYPVVAILPRGTMLDVQGCLPDYRWCDVIGIGQRGWVYAANIQALYAGAPVRLIDHGPALGIAVFAFILGSYWDSFYRDRPWYRDRGDWMLRSRPPQPHLPAAPRTPAAPPALRPPPEVRPPTAPPLLRPPAAVRPPPAQPMPPGGASPPAQPPGANVPPRPIAPPPHPREGPAAPGPRGDPPRPMTPSPQDRGFQRPPGGRGNESGPGK